MSGRSSPSSLFAAVLIAAASTAVAQEAQWLQNFADAKTKAAADGKDLLVDFTGSDWCVWCKRLDKEVFAEKDFEAGIQKDFVLVKLDFPQDESLITDEIRAQNTKLQGEYGVEGFPTIFLMDAAGRPYAQTGYQKGGPGAYLEHVAGLKKSRTARDEHFTKAKDAQGLDRARHLAAGLDAMDEGLVLKHYKAEVDEILKLDDKNEAGLQAKFAAKLAAVEIDQKFNELAQDGNWDDVEKLMVESLDKYKGNKVLEQKATFYRAVVLIESKQDFDGALKLIDAARAFDPESEFGKRLEQIRKNVEQIKKQHEGEQGGEDKKKDGGD